MPDPRCYRYRFRTHPLYLGKALKTRACTHKSRLVSGGLGNACFTPMCGRLRVGKDFFHERDIGRCGHVFGLLMRFT
jgi:hypothetical protein